MHKIRCYCRSCKQDTNQDVLFTKKEHSNDDDYWWIQEYMITQCCGCDTISHCDAITEEGNIELDENGNEYIPPVYNVIPDPIQAIEPIKSLELPIEIRQIYLETVKCINSGNLILAGAGCRATIEAICKQQQVQGKQLESKINKLAQKGIITKNDRDHLHAIRFMGNDSIHNAIAFDLNELIIVAKIINTILTSIYIIHNEFQKLKEKPITTYEEFIKVLDKCLDSHQIGDVGGLAFFTKGVRGIIQEDRAEFENNLIADINSGNYTRLALLPKVQNAKNNQYKVC